ncbi:MAG: TadE family protein [Caldilinea sp.]
MKPRFGQERGQDLVEYALILPLFLFLVFTIIELSMLFFAYVTVSNAAREGARTAASALSNTCDQTCVDALAESAARSLTTGLVNENVQVITSRFNRGEVPVIQVEVLYRAEFLTRMVVEALNGTGHLDLSAASTMAREQ